MLITHSLISYFLVFILPYVRLALSRNSKLKLEFGYSRSRVCSGIILMMDVWVCMDGWMDGWMHHLE